VRESKCCEMAPMCVRANAVKWRPCTREQMLQKGDRVHPNKCRLSKKAEKGPFLHVFRRTSMDIHRIANRRVGGDSTHNFVSFSYTSFLGSTNIECAESFHVVPRQTAGRWGLPKEERPSAEGRQVLPRR